MTTTAADRAAETEYRRRHLAKFGRLPDPKEPMPMAEHVPAEQIEGIVGVHRHPKLHIGRAVSDERKVYVLHPHTCLDAYPDLTVCPVSVALDAGIDAAEWVEDVPFVVTVDAGRLVPDPAETLEHRLHDPTPLPSAPTTIQPGDWEARHEGDHRCAVCPDLALFHFVSHVPASLTLVEDNRWLDLCGPHAITLRGE